MLTIQVMKMESLNCKGVVDRIEDNQIAVILIESKNRELLIEKTVNPMEEGDIVFLNCHVD